MTMRGEIIMSIIIFSFVLIFTLLSFFFSRIVREHQLRSIEKDPSVTAIFKKKTRVVKKRIREKNEFYLVIVSFFFALGLISLGSTFLALRYRYQSTVQLMNQLEKQTQQLSVQHLQFPLEDALNACSQLEIDLKEEDWKDLFKEGLTEDERVAIEANLSDTLARCFGDAQVAVAFDRASYELSIHVIEPTAPTFDIEGFKQKIEGLVREAKDVPALRHIHLRLSRSIGETNTLIYSADYLRGNDSYGFERMNDFEHRIDLEGEKG